MPLRWSQMLDVVVALRDRAFPRAAHALRPLADAERSGETLPPQILGIVQAALAADDGELRDVAVELLDDVSVGPGWEARRAGTCSSPTRSRGWG